MYIRRPMCFISLAFMLLTFIVTEFMGGVDLKEYSHDYSKVTIKGTIKDKAHKNDKNILYIDDINGKAFGMIVYLEEQDIELFKLGQQVVATGKYSNFSLPDNEGEFNMRKYYRIHGFEASLTSAEIISITRRYGKIKSYLYDIKQRTKELFFMNLSETDAGTLSAMVLGDKSELDADVKELYQRAGIAHILAMSGLHIATVGLFLFSFINRIGMKLLSSALTSSVIMILYGMMTGMSTSTMRALIMFLLGVIAKCIGRTYDLMSAVCLSAIIILIENPFFIYDSGFLMSVLSVTGIGVIYPEIIDLIRAFLGNRVADSKIISSLSISLSTMISTLPVVMNSFFKISRYGILANLIIVPLMSFVLFIGLFAGVLNLLLGGIRLSIVLTPLFCVCEKILGLYNVVAGIVSKLSGNTFVTGKTEWWNISIYIFLMLIFVLMKKRWRIIPLVAAACILVCHPKEDLRINVLYVGQGACNVVYGKSVPTIMIDGGSTDVKDVYKYKVKPNLLSSGIDKIDYLFITHPDEDHISAIRDLINDEAGDVKVRNIVLSIADKMALERLRIVAPDDAADCKIDDIKIWQMNAGQKIEGDGFVIEAVSPKYQNGMTWEKLDANAASLVIKLTHKRSGFTALFTGDIDSETEKAIINETTSNLRNISFMTVPHHGSRNSSCEDFLRYVNPRICTISAGRGNSYGHPHKETLDRLDKFTPTCKVIRTDKAGQVSIAVRNGRVALKIFDNRK